MGSVLVIIFLTSGIAFGLTINIPDDYETIQDGLTAAEDGDTVLVAAGTYSGPGNYILDFAGKAVTLRSGSGPDSTVIDCQRDQRAIRFKDAETYDTRVEGFTLTKGSSLKGGSILCDSASPTISDCIITDNSTSYWARGVVFPAITLLRSLKTVSSRITAPHGMAEEVEFTVSGRLP